MDEPGIQFDDLANISYYHRDGWKAAGRSLAPWDPGPTRKGELMPFQEYDYASEIRNFVLERVPLRSRMPIVCINSKSWGH